MILADTNVISEVMKPKPSEHVVAWLKEHNDEVVISAITVQELRYGVALLPEGRRKRGLEQILDSFVAEYSDRIISFGCEEALLCGSLHAQAKSMGLNMALEDVMIAAISQSWGIAVATRNERDFEPLGITTINPF